MSRALEKLFGHLRQRVAILLGALAHGVWDVFARVRAVRDATEAEDPEAGLAEIASGGDELARPRAPSRHWFDIVELPND